MKVPCQWCRIDHAEPPPPGCPSAKLGALLHNRFELLEVLGAGGMGAVYLAKDRVMGHSVAVKTLRGAASVTPAGLARLRQEARAMSLVAHPAILQATLLGEAGPSPILVMPLLKGFDLTRLRVRLPLPPALAVRVALELLRPLAEAHRAGIAHRDLKPSNLFLHGGDGPPRLYLLDFGLAHVATDEAPRLTQLGAFIGTAAFAAPEQMSRESDAGIPADVFSMGALLYLWLTGHSHLRGGDLAHMSYQLGQGRYGRHPADLNPRVTEPLDRIVHRCLSPHPERRFADAGDLLRALESAEPTLARGRAPDPMGDLWHWRLEEPATPKAQRVPPPPDLVTRVPTPDPRSASLIEPVEPVTPWPASSSPPPTRPEGAPQPLPPRQSGGTTPPRAARGPLEPLHLLLAGVIATALLLAARFSLSQPMPGDSPLIAAPDGMICLPGGEPRLGYDAEARPAAMATCLSSLELEPHAQGWAEGQRVERCEALLERSASRAGGALGAFCLDRAEVSQREFAQWLNVNSDSLSHRVGRDPEGEEARLILEGDRLLLSCYRKGPSVIGIICEEGVFYAAPGLADAPMVQVTRWGAAAYCRDQGARLPTAAEWEWAARGASGRLTPWEGRDAPSCADVVWGRFEGGPCGHRPGRPSAVGRAPLDITPEGVRDLGGNVAEWTSDLLRPGKDPRRETKILGEVRGGSYGDTHFALQAPLRSELPASEHAFSLGFRCAWAPAGGGQAALRDEP